MLLIEHIRANPHIWAPIFIIALLIIGNLLGMWLGRNPKAVKATRKAPDPKPRITWGWCHCFGFGVDVRGWRCEFGGVVGIGATPAKAYRNWSIQFLSMQPGAWGCP